MYETCAYSHGPRHLYGSSSISETPVLDACGEIGKLHSLLSTPAHAHTAVAPFSHTPSVFIHKPRLTFIHQGNSLFHVDSSFNPRRAGFSLLRAHTLPPAGTGGNTDFADTRTAWDELPTPLRTQLLEYDYIGAHSLWHSRMKACPGSEYVEGVDPWEYPFGRHKLVQVHEGSGRRNLYVAAHLHHLEDQGGKVVEGGEGVIEEVLRWCEQERFVESVEWREEGDLVVWE